MAKWKPQEFYGHSPDGKHIVFEDLPAVHRVLQILGTDRLVFTIAKWYKKRSLDENNYYWGVVVEMICQETGNSPKQVHKALGEMFWPDEEGPTFTIAGRVFTSDPKSTTEMTTVEFEEQMEKVRKWAAVPVDDPENPGLGIYIPEPNEDPNKYREFGG